MDLPVAEVREQRGEDRRLGDVLTRVRSEVLGTLLRSDRIRRETLVGSAIGAEDRVRNLLPTMVTCHRPDPPLLASYERR